MAFLIERLCGLYWTNPEDSEVSLPNILRIFHFLQQQIQARPAEGSATGDGTGFMEDLAKNDTGLAKGQ